jgi:DNA-binding IclR family transcriptional regulator
MNALLHRGYVRRNPSNSKFRLGFKLFEVGETVVKNLDLREEAMPVLKEMAQKTGESAHLMVLDNDEALFLERVDGYQDVKVLAVGVAGRLPLHMGAGPKTLLAHLPEEEIDRIIKTKGLVAKTKHTITDPKTLREDLIKIRERGYELSAHDVAQDAAAIGCPILNWKGEIVGAISLGGLAAHFEGKKGFELVKIVMSAAGRLSRKLNFPYEHHD